MLSVIDGRVDRVMCDARVVLYHGLEQIDIDLLFTLPWININNLKYKQTYNTVCSVFACGFICGCEPD